MEKNDSTAEISTILLTEIYQDYQKNKRRQRWYSYLSYGILFLILGYMMVGISTVQRGINDVRSAPTQNVLPDKFVAAVKIEGPIQREGKKVCNYLRVNELLTRAFEHEDSVAVMLHINSPGGLIYDSQEIYQRIIDLKKQYPEKKVIAYIEHLAASGGYFIACAADEIHASSPYSLSGSIGVRIDGVNIHGFLKEHHIDTFLIHSGPNKGGLSLLNPITDESMAHIQRQLDNSHKDFIATVEKSRGERLKAKENHTFSGFIFDAKEALEQGLIDGYDVRSEQLIKEKVGDYTIEYLREPKPTFDDIMNEYMELLGSSVSRGCMQALVEQNQALMEARQAA